MTTPTKNKTVKLSVPVKIDGKNTSEIGLRCPKTGELRGLMLANVVQMETSSMLKLLPRITVPPMSEAQIADLPPADFFTMTREAVGFFITSEQIAQIEANM